MSRLIYTSNKTFLSLLSGPEEQALQSIILEREVIHLEYLHISEEASKNFPGIGELEEEEFYDDCGNRVPEERISFM